MRERLTFSSGYAEADTFQGQWARVGDRFLPQRIDVHCPSAEGQPGLRMALEVVDGRPQCRSITFESTDGGREVRQQDLRAIQVSQWVDDLFAAFAAEVVEEVDGVVTAINHSGEREHIRAVRQVQDARKGRAARKIDDEFLRGVADLYRANAHTRPGGPTEAVAVAYGVGKRMAATYVQQARKLGLLPETTQGKVTS